MGYPWIYIIYLSVPLFRSLLPGIDFEWVSEEGGRGGGGEGEGEGEGGGREGERERERGRERGSERVYIPCPKAAILRSARQKRPIKEQKRPTNTGIHTCSEAAILRSFCEMVLSFSCTTC